MRDTAAHDAHAAQGAPGPQSTVRITIDDLPFDVASGTTVAAALAAVPAIPGADERRRRGTRVSVGGEPREALCGMGICQECRVTIDGVAHTLACQTLCRDGQTVRTRTSTPTGLQPATQAGSLRPTARTDPPMTQHYDVVVIGAGPAGLNAAATAARHGASVAVLDDNPRAGGQGWRQGPQHPAAAPLAALLGTLDARRGDVALLTSARVVACLPDKRLLLDVAEPGGTRAVRVGYERLILATGARERLLPFAGWTLPGVTGAGALQALIKGGMPVRGERIVIAGSGPLLIAALATARAAGARIVAVVEQAPALRVARFGMSLLATPAKLVQAVQLTHGFAGVPYWTGSMVRAAHGDGRVEGVTIRRGMRDMTHDLTHDIAHDITLDCERIACGFGLVPNIALAQALGCRIGERGEVVVDDRQRTSVEGVFAAGECTGIGGMERARVEGEIAGHAASGIAAEPGRLLKERARWQRFAGRVDAAFALQPAARTMPPDDVLLCRCEDIRIGDVRGHATWRDAKLQTRCGMGACQGRVCGAAANLYAGWPAAEPRPPFDPTRIGTLIAASEDVPDVQ